jgi:Eco29kI restriction endonuclease
MSNAPVFNPLDKKHLGESVVQALENEKPVSLANLAPFKGAGIYAIYYCGGFPLYLGIARRNDPEPKLPLYVGKAVVAGARKGLVGVDGIESQALFKRIVEHRDSIAATKDLAPKDFVCRYLALDDIWIGLGESLLIQAYAPLWNTVIDGFGNHPPGKGRSKMMRPAWDELHTGRKWAAALGASKLSREALVQAVADYVEKLPGTIKTKVTVKR